MIDVRFSCYDTVNYLKIGDDIGTYLEAVIEEGNSALIAMAPKTWTAETEAVDE